MIPFERFVLNRYTIGALAAVLALIGIAVWGQVRENRGYKRGVAEVTAKVEAAVHAEAVRMSIINAIATERGIAAVQKLAEAEAPREALRKEIEIEAGKDPRGSDIGLDASSVRQLNAIR